MEGPTLEVQPDAAAVAHATVERIVRHFHLATAERETFSLCLAGGSTPKAAYELLATPEFARRVDWARVEIFFGDERCVPPDSDLSNFKMAKAALLDRVPIPGDNVYRMKGELDPEEAAKQYGLMLKEKFGNGGMDLVLLGMGDDGHTLSLFPGTAALSETEHRCVANHVPREQHPHIPEGTDWRITLTAPFVNRSENVLVLVTGAGKARALSGVLEMEEDRFPLRLIDPGAGRLTFLLDPAAAGMHADEEP